MARAVWIAALLGGVAAARAARRRGLRLGDVFDFFVEEPEVARFTPVVESANGLLVPNPLNDRHIQHIHAPGLLEGSVSVIFFRTTHTGRPEFRVRLNAPVVTHHTLVDPGPHSWHEIVPAGVLKPTDNELTLFVTGDGTVTFSDVVILYTSNRLTVRRPPVLTPT
jgi:hypothetical protein